MTRYAKVSLYAIGVTTMLSAVAGCSNDAPVQAVSAPPPPPQIVANAKPSGGMVGKNTNYAAPAGMKTGDYTGGLSKKKQ